MQGNHRKSKEAEDFGGYVMIADDIVKGKTYKTTITPKYSHATIQQNIGKEQQLHQQHSQQRAKEQTQYSIYLIEEDQKR